MHLCEACDVCQEVNLRSREDQHCLLPGSHKIWWALLAKSNRDPQAARWRRVRSAGGWNGAPTVIGGSFALQPAGRPCYRRLCSAKQVAERSPSSVSARFVVV